MFRNNHSGKAKLAVLTGFVTEAFFRSNTAAEEASVPASTNPCQWNSNWDMRKPNKNKVVHQIVMVRHGQYDRDGKTDAENILTAVGREQAEATGKRLDILLKSGQIQPVKNIYYSTMARATETCKLILPQISDGAVITDLPSTSTINTNKYTALGDEESISVPHSTTVQACSMIREGAVCAPNPPCTGWNPSEEDFEKEGTRVSSCITVDFGIFSFCTEVLFCINFSTLACVTIILCFLFAPKLCCSIFNCLNFTSLVVSYVMTCYVMLSYCHAEMWLSTVYI